MGRANETPCYEQLAAAEKRIAELEQICRDANMLFTEIMPQGGKLVFQDYGLLNATLIALNEV